MSFIREKLVEKFNAEYERLNDQQKTAVDAIEGPVMVIAGPGTGKTQILACRIGNILLKTDVNPENILCLTFTDAGVIAMRKRLLQFIGPDAYKVNINTYHSFCNEIIQDNLSLFDKTYLDPISELEQIELMKELIDGFKKGNPLKRYRGDVYFETKSLLSLFSTMKKEGWTPQFLNEAIDRYINDLPFRDENIAKKAVGNFKKGDVRTDRVEIEVKKVEKLRAAVNEFERFQEAMRKRNRYDFDDMINWVIQAFKENQSLLLEYQEKYQFILVDEYQDSSGTQNMLVSLLINYWEQPNIFVVGDDDQSIYRFQGANLENMVEIADQYKAQIKTIVLSNNYRSTQPILNIAKSLIDRNNERLVQKIPNLTKELIASNPKWQGSFPEPKIVEFENKRVELIGITDQISKWIQNGVNPSSIAVLYRENAFGSELQDYLKLKNIPFYSKRRFNLFGIPLINKILLHLRYINAELDTPYGGDEMLFELLHANWYGIPPIEIAKITSTVAEKRYSEDGSSLRKYLFDKATEAPRDLFATGIHPGLKKAITLAEKFIGDAYNVTLQQLFESIIRETGILSSIMQSPNKHHDLEALTSLFNFVKDETHRNPSLHLKEFVGVIDIMEREGIELPLMETSGSEKGVNLLTNHGSKGLEFEHVIVAGCDAKSWEKKANRSKGFKLPDTVFSTMAGNASEEELRRLFYVAITRAEKELIITYSKNNEKGKALEPTRFIAEIIDSNGTAIESRVIDPETIMEYQSIPFNTIIAPEIEKIEADFIDRILEKFTMNVTALNNYLNCPLNFYFNNLVRIPSPKNESTEFGSAVHFALEKLFKGMQEHPANEFPSKDQFTRDFDWYMHRHRESFTQEQFNRRMEYGHEILSTYYDNNISRFNKIVAIERNIRNVVVNGVPLKGKLDKLEFNGKEVNVVDYKTGDPEKADKKLKRPNDKDPNGGDYWRQAVFYKILIDHYEQKDWKVVSTEFDFIEPTNDKKSERAKVDITAADVTTVKQQIVEVWEKIQARDFYTGCGKADCHWCEFVKTNNMAVALHELSADGEEDLS